LTSPVIGTIVNTGTLTLPTSTDTLVGRATTDTLTNKTLTSPVIGTIVNTGTLTLPTSTDTLVGRATTDTLTNKTLTSPVIGTIVNTGTLTLPTSTDTLVGRATTDTLTNKTLGAFTISGTVSGGGNQINNVIIGTTSPLAGTFTDLNTTGLVKIPSANRSAAAALTPTNPAFLYGVASTYTDTSSSGPLTPIATFYSLAQPTLSTSYVTTYATAATLYLANAPVAGGSATITNAYSLYVAAGASYFGGAVTFASSVGALTVSSLTNTGLTSGRVPYSTTSGLQTDSANLTFNGTTLTANTIGAFTLSGTVAGGGNQINNVIIGTTTPLAGAFTTLASNAATTFTAGTASTTTGTGTLVITGGLGVSGRINAANFDGIVGANTAAAGSFTTLSATSNIYTSARYFAQRQSGSLSFAIGGYSDGSAATVLTGAIGDIVAFGNVGGDGVIFANSNTERMRLTDTGLGIGTSSIDERLCVVNSGTYAAVRVSNGTNSSYFGYANVDVNYNAFAKAGDAIIRGFNGVSISGNGGDAGIRLDNNSNLGVGISPSANAGQSTLNVSNYNRTLSALTMGSNGNSAGYVGYNMGNTNTANTYRYIASDTGSVIYFAGNEMRFMQFASGSAGATTSGTQAMTLDASGNLLVGTTTASANFYVYNAPVSYAGLNATAIFSSSASQSTGTGGLIAFEGKYTSGGALANFAAIGGLKENSTDSNYSGYLGFYTRLNGNLAAERARIDSSGSLIAGTSSSSGAATPNNYFTLRGGTDTDAGNYTAYMIYSNSTTVFGFRNDGYVRADGVYNKTSGSGANVFVDSSGLLYRSTSSLKYKKDVQDATHGLAEVLALRSVTYKGKNENDGDKVFGGLIAEEVHEAGLTEFVQYAEDGNPDALNYGNMVSLCVKAIQEQQALITTLTARISALESA
jgi:hypothetical protein